MGGRTLIHLALLAALALFYAATASTAWRPQVSEHYRDYYIRRTTTDWKVERGPARLADGIDFSQAVYPLDVDYVRGMSAREPWGRWSDANRGPAVSILLREPLSGTLCLDVTFRTTQRQAREPVMIRLGDATASVVPPDTDTRTYRVELRVTQPGRTIDLEPSQPAPAGPQDQRRIAIGLIRLRLLAGACSP